VNPEKTPIHILDFEGNTRTGVVEYGVAVLRDHAILETHTRFCRGHAPIDERDSRLHGIRNEAVAHAEPLSKDWLLFSGFRRVGVMGAHHAVIEDTLLRQVWPYPGMVPDFMKGEGVISDWGPWVDTRRFYEFLFPDLESYQLMDLIRTFHLEDELETLAGRHCPEKRRRPHCALFDALASALLIMQISRIPGYENMDLWWLLFNSVSSIREQEYWSQGELF